MNNILDQNLAYQNQMQNDPMAQQAQPVYTNFNNDLYNTSNMPYDNIIDSNDALFNIAFPEYQMLKDSQNFIPENENIQRQPAGIIETDIPMNLGGGTQQKSKYKLDGQGGYDTELGNLSKETERSDTDYLNAQKEVLSQGVGDGYGMPDTSFLEDKMGKVLTQQEKNIKERTEYFEKLKTDLNTFSEDLKNQEIDPNRFWNKKDTSNKIMAAIGLTLAGLTPHTMQAATTLLNNAIQNDIESQKMDLTRKDSLYQKALVRYGNELDAEISVQYKYMNAIKAMFDTYYKKAAYQRQKDQIQITRDNAIKSRLSVIDKLKSVKDAQLAMGINKNITKGGPVSEETYNALKNSASPELRKQSESLIPGFTGRANSPADKKEVVKNYTTYRDAMRIANQMIELNKSIGTSDLVLGGAKNNPKLAEFKALFGILLSEYVTKLMKVGGKVTDTDLRIAKESLGDMLGWFNKKSNIEASLNKFKEEAKQGLEVDAVERGFKAIPKD